MRHITFALVLLFSLVLGAAAQTPMPSSRKAANREGSGWGYVFAGPGGTSGGGTGTLQIGGGGEGLLKGGVGVGAELAYLTPIRSVGDGIGMFSVNGSYHFLKASDSGKLVPFVTGGYTGFFRSGYANGVNFGGGVNYWFKPRVGLRVEFRDSFFAQDTSNHFMNVRVGITFR